MLSFFTIALIALFVMMTWFETPAEPLVRHHSAPDEEPSAQDEDDIQAA